MAQSRKDEEIECVGQGDPFRNYYMRSRSPQGALERFIPEPKYLKSNKFSPPQLTACRRFTSSIL
jgi:hypothetical protein